MPQKKKTIGLALAGGASRGVIHLGAIQALEELGISFDVLSGTSAGSIVGALYLSGNSPEEIFEIIASSGLRDVIRPTLKRKGLMKHEFLAKLLKKHAVPEFESLQTPLYIPAVNLQTGMVEVFSSGPLYPPVIASSSIPLLFTTTEINGTEYVDGGLRMNLPVRPIRPLVDIVIGINILPLPKKRKRISNIFDVGARVFDIAVYNNIQIDKELTDIFIEDESFAQFNKFTFQELEKRYEVGYNTVMAMKNAILSRIHEKS